MDDFRNPYASGAGTTPPELASRDSLLKDGGLALRRIKAGRHAKSFLLTGLRGVGKTALPNRIAQDAEEQEFVCLSIEAREKDSLPSMLIPELHKALPQIGRGRIREAIKEPARRALNIPCADLAMALEIKYQGIAVGLDANSQPLVPATGNLENDLPDVLRATSDAKHLNYNFARY